MSNFYPYISLDEYRQFSLIRKDTLDQAITKDPDLALFISNSCSSSTSIVNENVGGRYTMPLSSVPFDVKYCCARIMDWNIMARRGYAPTGIDTIYKTNYDMAMKWLENVKNGAITIDASPIIFSGSSAPETLLPDQDTKIFGVLNPCFEGARTRNW